MTNSIALLATQSPEMTMTLKEITDMLRVRHNDAMQTVATMAKSPDFGELRKSRSSYKNNFGATLPLDTSMFYVIFATCWKSWKSLSPILGSAINTAPEGHYHASICPSTSAWS